MMKDTYSTIRSQIAKLERQAETLRKREVAGVIAKIRQAIEAYGLTAADLGLGRSARKSAPQRGSKAGSTTIGVPKYRDPATGKTWTGRGKPPAWIVGVESREPYLIDRQAAGAANEASPKRRTRSSRKGRGTASAKD